MIDLSLIDRMLASLVLVVGVGLLLATAFVVGPTRLRRTVRELRDRVLDRLPALAVLGVVIVIVRVGSDVSTGVSWLIGWNITSTLYAVEGDLIPLLQSFASPPVTAYLAFVYVYGFSFLLIFPFVAYTAVPNPRPFREAVVAYAGNYLGGLVCYSLFVAYGPRNHLPGLVDSLLYANWPSTLLLTAPVTSNTNVFPSLHTSFSVTVALLAWRTRSIYPRWALVAAAVAASIVLATMYLGIHWATDVAAGIALAVGSVAVARRDPLARSDERLRAAVEWARDLADRLRVV